MVCGSAEGRFIGGVCAHGNEAGFLVSGRDRNLGAVGRQGDSGIAVVEGEIAAAGFDPGLVCECLGYGDGSKGGRPPFDPVSMFKAFILQAQHNLSDARMEFMIRDRLSWMRFIGFDLGGATPDENTIRQFRNRLSGTGTLKRVMKAFEGQLHEKGYIPMSGQIVDASLVPAPRQRNTQAEKAAIKAGKSARQIWPDNPNKAAQKDVDARWTLKTGGQVRHRPDGTPLPMIATPVFGYKSHIGIDRRFGFIRKAKVTSASQADGRQLRHVIDTDKTASDGDRIVLLLSGEEIVADALDRVDQRCIVVGLISDRRQQVVGGSLGHLA